MVSAFSPPPTASQIARAVGAESASFLSAEPKEAGSIAFVDEVASVDEVNDSLEIPLSYDEMILQASRCMSGACERGATRQIVRVLLPRDVSADRPGVQFEPDARAADRSMSTQAETKLVPSDESWQVI